MIILLRAALIVILFVISKNFIYRIIGKRAEAIVFEKNGMKRRVSSFGKRGKGVILFCGVFLLMLISGYNVVFSVVMGGIASVLPYGAKSIKKGIEKKQVLCDLLNVSECLRVQISSQIPLNSALCTLSELCENKEFASLLTNIYLEYELSKFVISDATSALTDRFDYPEIRIFISALNQQVQGTSAIEAFDNLISILREKYIEFLEDATKSKVSIMTVGVFGIVLNIAALGIYPVAVEAFNAMNLMLK